MDSVFYEDGNNMIKYHSVHTANSYRSILFRTFFSLFLILVGGKYYSYSQEKENVLDRRYSFSYGTIPVSAFFDSLSVNFGLSFSYDASVIKGDSLIFADAKSVRLDEWLLNCLKNDQIRLHLRERQVILSYDPFRLPDETIHIEGTVRDGRHNHPMEMVNIGIQGKTIGTATNREGRFSVRLPRQYIGEKLVFSNLGYLQKSIPIPAGDTLVQITLHETSIRLPEVLVRFINPDRIMEEVSRQKKVNYPTTPLLLSAFFRESIQQDNAYVDVTEAVIEIYKPPYDHDFDLERVRFIKGRKGESESLMKMIDFKLQGGPYLFSRVDIVRQGGFLPHQEGNSKYRYFFQGMDYEQGRNVFVVAFEPINDNGELLYQGEIRIDEKTFAVISANFEMTRKTIRKSREYLIRKDSRRYRARPYFARYHIDYRPWKDKWILNSIRGELSMKIIDRKKRVKTVFNTVSEMLITDLQPGQKKDLRWSESFKENYILSDQIEIYDPNFWSKYNIIRPDESIKKIFQENADDINANK
ncbi:carboxypeptidase-like regulatory domain-containing protein [Thermophagus sp. OGC60D27]|uniref:carboxypeptidase-like regulatory domain-containing protein n=1 Tax=Thermophagus sp. OGC60D27 TaxID=3458415 RepID=UPI004037E62A